jgi:hypothetical protein
MEDKDICKFCKRKDNPCEDGCPWLACNARDLCEKQQKQQEIPMTEEKKTPSCEDITHSFHEKCQLNQDGDSYTPCPYCDLREFGLDGGCGECSIYKQGTCLCHYLYDVLTGKRPLDKPLWNPPKTPEWFKVGAKLWRKAFNDWYTITDLTPAGFHEGGSPIFAVEMVASDGSEDKETLPYTSFTPEAPFSESFRELFVKRRAWHKILKLVVEITDYIYEDNEVEYSYYNKDGDSVSALAELHEEDFEDVKFELPEWFQDGAVLLDDKGNLVEVVDYETYNDNRVYIHYKPMGGEEADVTSSGAIPYEKVRKGETFKPIKFRPYESIEELEKLLGKKLRFERELPENISTSAVEIITSVECDRCNGYPNINCRPYKFYSQKSATIDGLPIGVPVVDEELLNP